MGEREAGVIAVEGHASGQLSASGARLHITVEGESFFYGNQALQKAKELSKLVARLRDAGVDDDRIDVTAVELTSKSGLLSASSSARYDLAVAIDLLETVPNALGAIAASKTVTLRHVEWRYDQEAARRMELLATATAEALARAKTIAKTLGVPLGAPKRVSDTVQARETRGRLSEGPGTMQLMARAKIGGPLELGTTLSHQKSLSVQIHAEFWVDDGPAGA